MSAPLPLRYEGNGDFRVMSNYWSMRADKDYVVGETYKMVEHHDRSGVSHNHYFAVVTQAWGTLPDHLLETYPTVEHLRKKALIWKGYRDERSIVASNMAEAQRLAAFVKPMDDFAVVTVKDTVVRVWTAKSQKKSAMDAREFQQSKSDVLDFIDDLLGVDRGSTAKSEAA